jgi:hypothetical protein
MLFPASFPDRIASSAAINTLFYKSVEWGIAQTKRNITFSTGWRNSSFVDASGLGQKIGIRK